MSWFDSFFDSGSWVAPVISGVASIAGAAIASDANRDAAAQASQAAQAQADAIKQGNALAQQRFETVQSQTAPALEYQRQQIAGANTLTPEQQSQLDDVRRVTNNSLAVSGLRGSGRAAVAAVRKSETDFTNSAMEANRRRADSAASGLSGQYFSASNQSAGLDAASGRADGQAAGTQGMIGANYSVADATLKGRAIGDIASVINDTVKEGRRSNYGGTNGRRPGEENQPSSMAG